MALDPGVDYQVSGNIVGMLVQCRNTDVYNALMAQMKANPIFSNFQEDVANLQWTVDVAVLQQTATPS